MLRYLNKSFFKFFLGFVAILAISFIFLSFGKIYEDNQVESRENLVTE